MFRSILFELIKGEMDYVKDLENIEVVCSSYSHSTTWNLPCLGTDVRCPFA